MPYPEYLIAPMRGEMTDMGAKELRTAAEVDDVVKNSRGVVMMVVNSVCGCAAGKARPGIALALRHPNRPDVLATVFAGADIEATDRARQYFSGYAPSSPSIALLRDGRLLYVKSTDQTNDGRLLYMLERSQIENRNAEMIADELTRAFDTYCKPTMA